MDRTFYLGPVGAMVGLPVPQANVARPLNRVGGVHTSLDGTTTIDTVGFKRRWSLAYEWRFPGELEAIELMRLGAVKGPLRLLDPMSTNRLSAPVSTTGAILQNGVLPFSGDGTMTAVDDWPAGVGRIPLNAIEWSPPDTGGDLLGGDFASGIPLVEGEPVTFGPYARSLAGRGVRADLHIYDATGARTSVVTGSFTTADSWERISVTHTASAGEIVAVPVVQTPSFTGGGDVRTAAWQLEAGTTPTKWLLGEGCPEVLISEFSASSPYYPMTDAPLTLLEV